MKRKALSINGALLGTVQGPHPSRLSTAVQPVVSEFALLLSNRDLTRLARTDKELQKNLATLLEERLVLYTNKRTWTIKTLLMTQLPECVFHLKVVFPPTFDSDFIVKIGAALRACDHLQDLELLCVTPETLALFPFPLCSATLTHVKISSYSSLRDLSFLRHCCPNLQILELSNLDGALDLSPLVSCKALHTVCLYNNPSLRDLSALGQCPKLHTVYLSSCAHLWDIAPLVQCANLHTLTLSRCGQLRDFGPLAQCANLQKLTLADVTQTNTSALGLCHNLTTVCLYQCEQLTDVSALGRCSNLTTVCLSGCDALTDVSALGQCSNLTTVCLSRCDQLTDVSAFGQCAKLTTVRVSRCRQLPDVSSLPPCRAL